jgi:hypothetical protein
MIFSIAAFEGNALLLKNSHTLIKKLMKSCDIFIITGNIEFLFEKTSIWNFFCRQPMKTVKY